MNRTVTLLEHLFPVLLCHLSPSPFPEHSDVIILPHPEISQLWGTYRPTPLTLIPPWSHLPQLWLHFPKECVRFSIPRGKDSSTPPQLVPHLSPQKNQSMSLHHHKCH